MWWCNLGLNIGFEQDGKGEKFARPVLVLRKFSHQVFWGIPLTKSKKSGKYYVPLLIGSIDIGFAIISQLRLIDAKRLYQKLGDITHENHEKIAKMVSTLCLEPFKNSKG